MCTSDIIGIVSIVVGIISSIIGVITIIKTSQCINSINNYSNIKDSTINNGVINNGLGVKDTNSLIEKALDDYSPVKIFDEEPDMSQIKAGQLFMVNSNISK